MCGDFIALKPYFHSIYVKVRYSCPYTHQQNGLVERKHQHITEMGLSLLAQASLPFQVQWDAFSIVVLLINSLPSLSLNKLSPYFLLFKRVPNYTFLKFFGCTCYPFLRPYNDSKLQFRSSKCLFLGYSDSRIGYKYLHSSGRIYISKTVEFNELEFPHSILFPSTSPSSFSSTGRSSLLVPYLASFY